MDDDFAAVYTAEQRMGTVTLVLTGLAIFIACIGLFGLAAYAAEQRAKEIGIRKILGANTPSIVALLSKDFGRLIALSIFISTPIAAWSLHRWLENFAYRTTISPWLFAAAAAIVLLAAALTTLFQSLKAAVANPVEALRSE
jgi:putative ABC transport system permease protein